MSHFILIQRHYFSSSGSRGRPAGSGLPPRANGFYGGNAMNRSMNGGSFGDGSPVGWDKSYPLKPVNGTLYRKNSSVGFSTGAGGNKYSGNYGPKRSASQSRSTSIDRLHMIGVNGGSNGMASETESGYSSTTATMARTKSHHALLQGQASSSGEESVYGVHGGRQFENRYVIYMRLICAGVRV